MAACIVKGRAGAPHIDDFFAQHISLIVSLEADKASNAWRPGGKRVRAKGDDADSERKFEKRTEHIWGQLQAEVQRVVQRRRLEQKAEVAESRRIAMLHPIQWPVLNKAGDSGNTEKDSAVTPDFSPNAPKATMEELPLSADKVLSARQTPAMGPTKVGSPMMRDTAFQFSRSLNFKVIPPLDSPATKASVEDPAVEVPLISLYQ